MLFTTEHHMSGHRSSKEPICRVRPQTWVQTGRALECVTQKARLNNCFPDLSESTFQSRLTEQSGIGERSSPHFTIIVKAPARLTPPPIASTLLTTALDNPQQWLSHILVSVEIPSRRAHSIILKCVECKPFVAVATESQCPCFQNRGVWLNPRWTC